MVGLFVALGLIPGAGSSAPAAARPWLVRLRRRRR